LENIRTFPFQGSDREAKPAQPPRCSSIDAVSSHQQFHLSLFYNWTTALVASARTCDLCMEHCIGRVVERSWNNSKGNFPTFGFILGGHFRGCNSSACSCPAATANSDRDSVCMEAFMELWSGGLLMEMKRVAQLWG
jgi:hypothetical protein